MSLFSIPGMRLAGVSACVPKNKVSNRDFELIGPKERELLIKTTGIETRRVAAEGVCASDLCVKSAEVLLEALEWEPGEIEVLIFITQTPDYITPATSNIIQDRLRLSRNCIALDINLGCSGYVYGLSMLSSLLQSIGNGKGLLLVGDVSTACISDKDKSTTPIFSDAVSATAVEVANSVTPITFNLQGDGKGYETIIIPDGGYRHPFSASSLKEEQISDGIIRNRTHLILNGIDIYNFSVNEVPSNVERLLEYSGKTKGEIDYCVFHQANKIINDAIRKKLDLAEIQVPSSLRDYGNTSSATIPVTIVTQIHEVIQERQLALVFSGFGVGLSWSSVYLETDKVVCPPIIEI